MEDAVSNFSCEKNLDVENFLREDAINREKRDLTRTYLIIDQNKFESDNEIIAIHDEKRINDYVKFIKFI